MLPESWEELSYHPLQYQAFTHPARWKALACGRGSGKTEISRRFIVTQLAVRKPWMDPMYFYALPTYNQARRVAWKPLKKLIPDDWIKNVNETHMYVETVFGSTLYVVGMDQPQRIEGVQWDGCVIDESSDQRPNAFNLSVLPALTHRKGWCWRIGVPKRFGIGAGEFKEFFNKCIARMDDQYAGWTWPSEDILDPDEIAMHKEALDERDYNEQYKASWEKASGAIFYSFSSHNLSPVVEYDQSKTITVGSDFNVDPMAWVLCHDYGTHLQQFDELYIRNTNTEETLNILYEKYGNHYGGWEFIGDASAAARKTSAARSDYAQIKNDERFLNKRVLYPKKNPPIADRFAACNALFKNANDVRRYYVNPRCKHTIQDLEQRAYKPGTREPNDTHDIGHISDALGYIIYCKYPVKVYQSEEHKVAVYA